MARLDGEPIGASLAYYFDGIHTYAHAEMDLQHGLLSSGIMLMVQTVLYASL